MTNKEQPVARCTRCGHYTMYVALINQRCPRRFIKKGRCKGIYRSMLAPGDWSECKNCFGLGIVDHNDCSDCQGTGWVCVRGLNRVI